MSPEGFEPPTFGSGIRRAAIAPWAPWTLPPWDSNPNLILGRDKYYPCTMDAFPERDARNRARYCWKLPKKINQLQGKIPRPGIEPGSVG